MRDAVKEFTEFMEPLGVTLYCPVKDCNQRGQFYDHIASSSGFHFKNLWQRGFPLPFETTPYDVLRDMAWEQINIRGGAIRYNHLDWEVQMWKGSPPRNPTFGRPSDVQALPYEIQQALPCSGGIPPPPRHANARIA